VRAGAHVVEQTSLQRTGLVGETEGGETLDDPRQTQMIVIARMEPHAGARSEQRGIDLDTVRPPASCPPE
jgi:hypothetical protein